MLKNDFLHDVRGKMNIQLFYVQFYEGLPTKNGRKTFKYIFIEVIKIKIKIKIKKFYFRSLRPIERTCKHSDKI